jgi:hypothetical protein
MLKYEKTDLLKWRKKQTMLIWKQKDESTSEITA